MKVSYVLSNMEIEKQLTELSMLKLKNKSQDEKINSLQNEVNRLYLEKKVKEIYYWKIGN